MPSYKLTYFNSKGFGEVARLLFAAAGVEFEDVRLEREQWPEFKPRFVGQNDLEAARADMIVDGMADLGKPLGQIYYTQNESEKAELKKKFLEETLPQAMERFEKLLISNHGGDGYFVGDGLTWADILFSDHISWVPALTGSDVEWDKFPKLKSLKARVEAEPKIAEWIKNRPPVPV